MASLMSKSKASRAVGMATLRRFLADPVAQEEEQQVRWGMVLIAGIKPEWVMSTYAGVGGCCSPQKLLRPACTSVRVRGCLQ
jgi:hypothetical protein